MRTSKQTVRRVIAASIVLASGFAVGCESRQISQREMILKDPTPALDATYERQVDMINREAYVHDTNKRAIHDDLAVLLLLDRPTRLRNAATP